MSEDVRYDAYASLINELKSKDMLEGDEIGLAKKISESGIASSDKAFLIGMIRDKEEEKGNVFWKMVWDITKKIPETAREASPTHATGKLLKNIIDRVSKGQDPDNALRGAIRDKVIEDDPSLRLSDDPVEDSYRKKAIDILKTNGYPIVESNVNSLIEQLKQAE